MLSVGRRSTFWHCFHSKLGTGPFPKPLVLFEPIPMEGVAPVGWWEFGMGQIEDLRAAAKRLHEVAKAPESGGDRSILISRATELEVEADTIERASVPKPPAPEAPQHVAQQQQQPQPDDSKK